MRTLIVKRDSLVRLVPLLTDSVLIGRIPVLDVVLSDESVSRKHARLFLRNDRWYLQDLQSSGGTYVNRARLQPDRPAAIGLSDVIQIGPFTMTLSDGSSDPNDWDQATQIGQVLLDDQPEYIEETARSEGFGSVVIRPEDKLQGILKINEVLAGNLDVDAVFPKVLDVLFRIFPQCDRGAVLLNPDDPARLRTAAQRKRSTEDDQTVRISRVILGNVLTTGTAILSANTTTDPRTTESDSIRTSSVHSAMCVPMHDVDGRTFGVISLDSQNPARRFTSEDLELLIAVSGQAARAYENARLLQESLRQQQLRYEMQLAADIQRRLIPTELPVVPGYQFFGTYDAAKAVGGDYYDCFAMPNGHICVSFGDVAGKGFPAALIMARLSGIVRNAMQHTHDVAEAMTQINSLMCSGMVEGRFVTYILGILNPSDHTFRFANAGHMSPEIRHANGTLSVAPDERSGTVLGILDGQKFESMAVSLQPGDTIVLRTDGVDEAMNEWGDLYGEARFRRCVQKGASPESICETLRDEVKAFMPPGKQNDDITLFACGRCLAE